MPAIPINPITRRDMFILLLILLLAAFMRLERIGIAEFRYDEALLSTLAQDWLAGGPLPTRGLIASVGLPQGPWMVYLLAIPYALAADPLVATAFVALLNGAGVGLLWFFARRYFGPTVAAFAGVAYAVSPYAVLFSRKIWNPNMHTPILLIGVLLACYGFLENKRWAQVVSLPLFLLPMQFHYQGGLLIPVLLWILWMGRKNIRWEALAAGFGLTILTLLPLLSSITAKDIQTARDIFGGDNDGGGVTLSDRAATIMLQFMTGTGVMDTIAEDDIAAAIRKRIPPPETLWYGLLIFFVTGSVAVWRRYRHFAMLLYLWAFLTGIALTPTWINIYGHYFILCLPAIFLLVGVGAGAVIQGATAIMLRLRGIAAPVSNGKKEQSPLPAKRGGAGGEVTENSGRDNGLLENNSVMVAGTRPASSVFPANAGPDNACVVPTAPGFNSQNALSRSYRAVFAVITLIFTLIIGTQAAWQRALLTDLDTYATPLGMNAPLHYLLSVRDSVRDYRDVLVIGGDITYSSSHIWRPILRGTADCVRDVLVDGGNIAVFPARPFAVLIPPNPAPYSQMNLYRSAAVFSVPLRQGEGEYTIYTFDAPPVWTATPMTPVDVPVFENGIRLTGYHLTENVVYLRWQIGENFSKDPYQYYVHFLDRSGERIGQRDTAFYNPGYRCAGDTLITWANAAVPAQMVTLRAGMYMLTEEGRAVNVRWLDASGSSGGTGIDIPLENTR